MNKNCAICLENTDKQQIDFPCGHSFCLKCFPYLLYNKIISTGIQKDFFMELDRQYECLICLKGETQFKFIKLDKLLQEKIKNQTKCEFCEKKNSTKSCFECNQNYCDQCLDSFHKLNKKFISHKIFSFVQKKQINVQQLQCNCSMIKTIEWFCQNCKSSICKSCAKPEHEGHMQVLLSEIFAEFNRINSNQVENHLTKFYEAFKKFEGKFRKNFELTLEKEQNEFNQLVDEIISSLLKLKEKNKEKIAKEYQVLENQLSLIQTTLSFIKEEFERNSTLHPNKLFHLTRFFQKSDCENTFFLKNFEIFSTFGHRKLNVIKETLNKLHQYSDSHCLTFFEEGVIRANSKKTDNYGIAKNFQSDPIELINKKPIILEKGNSYLHYGKINSTTSFIQRDETFLAWPGSEDDNGNYSLHIYNLSNRKKEMILQGSRSYITSVSTYPKDSNYESKKWLYCTDRCGLFRVYDLEKYKQFREIIKIDTLVGSGILSAVVFEDQFKEITQKSQENEENVYVLMAFLEVNLPFRIYRINITEGKGEIIREIRNTGKKYCYTMNFFHDPFYSKTCIFFGLSHSFIQMFDLKSETFTKKFETIAHVTSINFFFKNPNEKEKIKRYLLYSQLNNLIIVANIDSGAIIKKVALPDISYLHDICLWDIIKGYFIIATSNKNSIKVMDLENLSVLKSKEMGDSIPLNIVKVLIKNENDEKECLVLFADGGCFPIILY